MRSILSVVSLLCIIIGSFLIVSIPFVGIFKVFSLFPEWFYIIVFLGIVIPYIVRENEINEAIGSAQQTNKKGSSQKPSVVSKVSNNQSHEPDKDCGHKFDTEAEFQVKDHLRMNSENIMLGSKTYPVQIVAHKNLPHSPLVAPFYDSKGNWKMDNKGKPLGYVGLEQKIQTLVDNHISFETRVALLKGTIEELLSNINRHQLEDGSELGGKIVVKESLEQKWKGHTPEIDKKGNRSGFTFYSSFYPVYREYIYTEDGNVTDEFVTEEQARIYANSTLEDRIADDLPF